MRAILILAVAGATLPVGHAGAAGPDGGTSSLAPPVAAPTTAEAASPGSPGSFRLAGWIRTTVHGTSGDPGGPSGEPAALTVPHDGRVARQLAQLRLRYARGRSFEAVASGLLTLEWLDRETGPPGLDDGTRTDADADLREAYFGLFRRKTDLRVGFQRVAWGHADTLSPNDVANAGDIRDPVLNETELLHRPTFLVRTDAALGRAGLQVIVEPFFEPDRYDTYGPNWALVQPDAPPGYRGLLGFLSDRTGRSPDDAGRSLLIDADEPTGLDQVQGGVRVDWSLGRLDITHYYHYGYHGTPDFRVDEAAVDALDAVDWSTATPAQLRPLLLSLAGSDAVGATWERRHHLGLDLVTTVGPFALRMDAAYEQPALFYDRNLNGWLSPAIETVLGAELQTGSLDRAIIVEGRYRRIRDEPPDGGLLFAERDSVDLAVLARWTWAQRLELEVRGVGGARPRGRVLRPQLAWKRDALAIRLGCVLLGGEEGSFGDWYRRNRGAYLMLRYAFQR